MGTIHGRDHVHEQSPTVKAWLPEDLYCRMRLALTRQDVPAVSVRGASGVSGPPRTT